MSDIQTLWSSIKVRSIVLLFCTIIIAFCTVGFWYRPGMEPILCMLFTELLISIILGSAHCYSLEFISEHKRKYNSRVYVVSEQRGLTRWGYVPYLVGILWTLMLSFYTYSIFAKSNPLSSPHFEASNLAVVSIVTLLYSSAASYFFARGIFRSYETIFLYTIPIQQADQGIEMANIPPAGAEANRN